MTDIATEDNDDRKPRRQSSQSLEAISQLIWRHLEERDWHDNKPRDLAISISLEANELLEHYQWGDKQVGTKEELAGELADIFIYAIEFAQTTGIDIASAVEAKLEKSAMKYPASDFKGRTRQEREKSWLDAKLNHRKEGL